MLKNYFKCLAGLFSAVIAANGIAQVPYAKNISPINAKSCSFVSATHGYLVGDRAKILETTDGGHTWEHYYTGIEKSYNKVKFFSSNIGVVLGSDTTMLITHDGGASWQQGRNFNLVFSSSDFSDIWFADANTWFVTGYNTVLKTTDGGTTWTSVNPNNNNNILHIWFTDSQTGYFTTNGSYTIYKTTDGGTSWNFGYSLNITSAPNDLYFINSSEGLVALPDGNIVRTSDGGSTFNTVYTGSVSLNSFSFIDSQNGYCAGADGTVLRTTDGGQTWTALTGLSTTYDFYTVHATSATTAEFYGEFGLRGRTSNGSTVLLESEWPIESSTLFAVDFSDMDHGLVSGYLFNTSIAVMLRTIDGGSTWTRSTVPSTMQEIRNIHYVTPAKVFAMGDNPNSGNEGVYLSVDSGKTFTLFNMPYNTSASGSPGWYDMEQIGTDSLFILGNYVAGFASSGDGGNTWTLSSATTGYGYDLTMWNSMVGFSSDGSGGGVGYTTDGGNNFSISAIANPDGMSTIDFAAANTIYVAGDKGKVFKTTDLGTSWTMVRNGATYDELVRMEFFDAQTGIVVGSKVAGSFVDPFMLYTTDGGLNFQEIFAPHNFSYGLNSLFNLDMHTSQTGYAVGEAANLYKICPSCNSQLPIVSGVEELNKEQVSIMAYPNPVRSGENIHFSLSMDVKGEYIVTNILGASVRKGVVTGSELDINTSGLKAGVYFVQVKDHSRTVSTRFIIGD